MGTMDLFKGIGVIIDDEIRNPERNLKSILSQINTLRIPFLSYETLPEVNEIENFNNISFVLLDWILLGSEFSSTPETREVRIPNGLRNNLENSNIQFLRRLKEICYCPVFIFSNENIELIRQRLISENLYSENTSNNIFIKSKAELRGRKKLFNEIENWLEKNPSIYVLKEWELEYQKAKNRLFNDLQEINPEWPKVFWKNFGDDGVNKSIELGELIVQNIHSRMKPFHFCNEILSKRGRKISKNELRLLLEGQRFLPNDRIHSDDIFPGDVFYRSGYYYLNIRPSCDLISNRQTNRRDRQINLYLLKGTRISEIKAKKIFSKEYGLFPEIESQSIIFPIDDGKIVDFRFKDMVIMNWDDFSGHRIGRILSPYIDKIQQRYALFLHRIGLPRIPKKSIFD